MLCNASRFGNLKVNHQEKKISTKCSDRCKEREGQKKADYTAGLGVNGEEKSKLVVPKLCFQELQKETGRI